MRKDSRDWKGGLLNVVDNDKYLVGGVGMLWDGFRGGVILKGADAYVRSSSGGGLLVRYLILLCTEYCGSE